jgi:hypothetical protein
MADPLQVSISGDAADVFRQQFNIQNVGQARDAASNLDALWNTPNPWSQQGRPEDRETFDWAGQEVQKRFESGRYQPETDAQPSDHFSKGNRIATRQNGSFKAVSNTPDVCKTLMGGSTPPVPYQIVADLGGSTGIVPSVRFNGKPAYVLDQSVVPTCTGDEPGTANGVKSGTVGGEVKPTKGSSTVRAGGHAIIRDGDPCTMNNGNCTGTYVTAPSAGSSINASGNVVGDANPPPDKGVMHQVGGFFKGAGGALWDMGKGLVGLGVGAAKLSSVSQAAEGLSNATGLYNYHGYSETQQAVSQTAQAIYNHPGAIVDGITKPYTEAWAQGNYGEALGRGAIDVGGLFVGGVGAAGKAGEAANVAGEVGEAASVIGKVGDVGETAQVAGRVGEAADAGAGVARAADATEGIANASKSATVADARPAGDGVKVSERIKSLRERYLGRTPGKNSRTGRKVQERMQAEGKLRNGPDGTEFKASDGEWYPLKDADMAHNADAVTWWNETGRQYGAKAPEVREWMLDPNNYTLDHYSINRSLGAQIGQTYLPPLK